MKSINPATGELVKEYDRMGEAEINGIIQKATAARRGWAELSYEQRAKRLYKAAKLLKKNSEEYAELMAREMGKPLIQGRSEAAKCAWVCKYYADNAEEFLSKEEVTTDAKSSYITYNPLGTVLAIMP